MKKECTVLYQAAQQNDLKCENIFFSTLILWIWLAHFEHRTLIPRYLQKPSYFCEIFDLDSVFVKLADPWCFSLGSITLLSINNACKISDLCLWCYLDPFPTNPFSPCIWMLDIYALFFQKFVTKPLTSQGKPVHLKIGTSLIPCHHLYENILHFSVTFHYAPCWTLWYHWLNKSAKQFVCLSA